MRCCDDLADEPSTGGREPLARWRLDLDRAISGTAPEGPLWPAFADAVLRYEIPHRYFHDMIDGVESDLDSRRFRTFEDLYRYCYRVASVVGLTVIHIFGYDSPRAPELAEKCGVAFQLTNILRDLREDYEMGRIYLPEDDLRRFDASVENRDSRLRDVLRLQGSRAQAYYDESLPLVDMVGRESRPSLWALIRIYRRLLERIEAADYDVWSRRIRVPSWEKWAILCRASFAANRLD
jgi:phytoene synthase